MTDEDFISLVDRLDRCWMRGRLQDLNSFLAQDVVFVAPGGSLRMTGIAQAIESYRQFTSHAEVKQFQTHDHLVTQRGDTAIVEYEWEMKWVASDIEHNDAGREVLVLARRNENWRVVWRAQIPTGIGSN
jgi:ketosteroid isomerase-like protein